MIWRKERYVPSPTRWFDLTEEFTPWGDLEIYQINRKYSEHRAVESCGSLYEIDVKSIKVNPWQCDNLPAEWGIHV